MSYDATGRSVPPTRPPSWWAVGSAPPLPPISTRRALVEVLAVFAAFFGAGVLAAGFSLGSDLPAPHGGWGVYLPNAFDQLALAGVAAALVLLLLKNRGVSRQAFGLTWPHRSDGKVAVGQTIRIATWAVTAFIVGGVLTSALATGSYNSPLHLNAPFLVYAGASALNAGVIEELVVLGFVVVTLEQARRPVGQILIVALVLRCSYHIYYGPGVIGIAVWASVFVWLYLRFRSLLPIVAVHFAWDLVAFLGDRWNAVTAVALLVVAAMLVTSLVTRLAERRSALSPSPSPPAAPPAWGPTGVPPSWQPDPWGQRTWRWWDGTHWTDLTA